MNTSVLSAPAAGWSTFTLGNFVGHLSYIDDVPEILLNTIETYLKTKDHAVMSFDEEGSEFHVLIMPFKTFIISEREQPEELYACEINAAELICQILDDLKRDIDKWAAFAVFEEAEPDYEDTVARNKANILTRIKTIKNSFHGQTTKNMVLDIKTYLMSNDATIDDIKDFLGGTLPSDILHNLEAHIDDTLTQMPDDIISAYYHQFCCKMEKE